MSGPLASQLASFRGSSFMATRIGHVTGSDQYLAAHVHLPITKSPRPARPAWVVSIRAHEGRHSTADTYMLGGRSTASITWMTPFEHTMSV